MSLPLKPKQLVDIILSNVVWRKYANVGSCSGRAHCILHTCVYSPGITLNMDWGETFKWFTVTFVMEWEFLQQSAEQQTGNTGTVLALQYLNSFWSWKQNTQYLHNTHFNIYLTFHYFNNHFLFLKIRHTICFLLTTEHSSVSILANILTFHYICGLWKLPEGNPKINR